MVQVEETYIMEEKHLASGSDATEKLYYHDSHGREFTATVLSCEEKVTAKGKQEGYRVVLDRTLFFPEGGGQFGDQGWIDGIKVTDTHEKNGVIYHETEAPIAVGTEVKGELDYKERFSRMQQHTGEHMLSGIIHGLYGYDNVGFHMGSDTITVDLNGPLDETQLAEIEQKTNEKIWEDTEVKILYPTAEELEKIDYRSKKELTGQVRIVEFPGVDICACCGTHVTHTGEIGMLKLLSVEKFREGVRIEMICGKRVLDYLNMVNDQNHQISVKLSAKMDKTAQAVERLQEENFRLKGQVGQMVDDMCQKEAERYAGSGSVLIFMDGMDADSVRRLADAVTQTCQGCCAVFSRNADGSFKYAMGEKDGDLRQFTKEMNAKLNGRGGGKPFFVQGSVQATEEEIRRFFEQ